MILLLVNVGRFTVVVAALIVVVIPTIAGWQYGANLDVLQYGFMQNLASTPNRLVYSALGLSAGLIASGSIFGFLAAIFDMQISLRALVKSHNARESNDNGQANTTSPSGTRRAEPRLTATVIAAALAILTAAVPAHAQESKDIVQCRFITENGLRLICYDRIATVARKAIGEDYRAMKLVDFKIDMEDLRGQKVAVPGVIKFVNDDTAFLSLDESISAMHV